MGFGAESSSAQRAPACPVAQGRPGISENPGVGVLFTSGKTGRVLLTVVAAAPLVTARQASMEEQRSLSLRCPCRGSCE